MISLVLLLQSSLAIIEIDHQKSMKIDPDQSPFSFHIQKNFNLVMVKWDDTNLTISIEDEVHTTKTITQLDGYSIFSFANNATIKMSYLSPTAFFVTEGPYLLKHGAGNNTFTISNECSVLALYRNTYADYIFSIYGYYRMYGQVIRTCNSPITLYYHKKEEVSSYSFQRITKGTNDINIDNATGPCKIIRESISDNMTVYGFGLAQNKCETPSIKATVITKYIKDSENHLQYDSNMAYGGNGEGVKEIKSLISEIEPRPLYRYRFDLSNLSSEYKLGFVYEYADQYYKELQGNEIIIPVNYFQLYLLYSPMPYNIYPVYMKNINYNSEIKYYNITEDDMPSYCRIRYYINIKNCILSSEYKVYAYANETYIEINNTNYKESQKYPFSINVYMISPFCEEYTLINSFNATLDDYHVDKIEEIPLICQKKPKTICICKEEDNSCEECTKDLEGIIKKSSKIDADPGKYYDIRVFENITISSDIFNIYHNISVDEKYLVVVDKVSFINEYENNSFICDYLMFSSSKNIIIRPKTSILNISVPSEVPGMPFTLEINDLVHLKPFTLDNKKSNYSNITVIGKGDLNIYKYPQKYIITSNNSKINLIEGLQVICDSRKTGSHCAYREIDNFLVKYYVDNINNIEFRPNTIIYYFIDTFDNDAVFDINEIYHSNLYIIRQETSELKLLSDNKLILNSSNIMTFSNEKVILDGETGGVLLRNVDADDYVVEYVNNLTIVQDGDISPNNKTISINTPNHDSKVIFNKSFDFQNQKLSFISDVPTKIVFTTNNKSMTIENLKEFIDFDENATIKIEIIEDNSDGDNTNPDDKNPNGNKSDPDDKNKGLSGGAIAGIVIGVIAVVAIVAAIAIFVIKKKRNYGSDQEGMDV